MEAFANTANPDERFYYQVGKTSTTIPWTRPSYEKLKDFLLVLRNDTSIFDRYSLHIAGGVLYNFNLTWDIDIFLYGAKQDPTILEQDLHQMYDLSLNRFNILIDVQWCESPSYDISYEELISPDFKHSLITYQKLNKICKIVGAIASVKDICEMDGGTMLTQHLVEVSKLYPNHNEKVLGRILRNPDRLLKATVPAEIVLYQDINYFLANTNH